MGSMIDLSKKARITLEKKKVLGEKVRVGLVLDISASMTSLFNNGTVQNLVERILALGMNMDDNGEIDLYLFGKNAYSVGTVKESDIEGYVKRVIQKNYPLEGYTNYAPPIRLVLNDFTDSEPAFAVDKESSRTLTKNSIFKKLFGGKNKEEVITSVNVTKEPSIVFFVTDGEIPLEYESETEKLIVSSSDKPIFWQFVGIGNSKFRFLDKLDNMEGRTIDNANFFKANDIQLISDEELYDRILTEFPDWLTLAREKGISN